MFELDDTKRAAILAFIQSVFPVLQFTGAVTFTGDQVAAIMFMIGAGLGLFALVFKKGQSAGPGEPAGPGS